jgi:alpha-glucosidase
MRFWLDRGIAGFRLDAITELFEDPQLRSDPVRPGTDSQGDPNVDSIYNSNLPRVHDVTRRMRAMVDSYPGNRVLVGETYLPNMQELDKWYGGAEHNELQLPMDMVVGFRGDPDRLDATKLRMHINDVETMIHGSQPLLVFDNHDNPRSHDRYGDGVHDDAIDKAIATILFTSRATALMYYGEELGMPTTPPTRKEDVKDPVGITGWPLEKGRDGERTPMQWTPGPQAGFSTDPTTWLPIPPSYKTINVQTESKEPGSILRWYEQLIELRRSNPALHEGTMTMLDTTNPSVLSFVRTAGDASVVVAVNCTATPQTITLHVNGSTVRTMVTDDDANQSTASLTNITLAPYASWVASVR